MAAIESFLRRTGRPLPGVLVMGRALARRCKQIDLAGGSALGLDAAPSVIEAARRLYPDGEFAQGDARKLSVDTQSLDGAWTEGVFCHVPRDSAADAIAAVHRALRPGGLLYVRLALGDGEGFEDTAHGRIYLARWQVARFEQTLGALDFTLLELQDLPGNEAGLVFRREY